MAKVVKNWHIVVSGDEYTAPEITRFHLQGEATWIQGPENRITTSPIVRSEGFTVVTRSGSRYELGQPESWTTKTLAEMRKENPGVPLN